MVRAEAAAGHDKVVCVGEALFGELSLLLQQLQQHRQQQVLGEMLVRTSIGSCSLARPALHRLASNA
jgi:hypothetical protein